MAAESELNPTSYIQHHLTFLTKPVGEAGGFWSVNWDTIITTLIIAVITFGFLWLVTRKATAGVPSKRQAFVELTVDFVNEQVKGIYHGESKLIAPIALTTFVLVLFLNAMDFLPVDIMSKFYEHVFGQHTWRGVPTADVNTTFALALSVFALMIFYSIKIKGLGGWIHELFCSPFGGESAAVAVQPAVQPGRVPVEAAVPLAAALRQHVRRRDHLHAARAVGRDRRRRRGDERLPAISVGRSSTS